jgi:hypothetical protein
LNKSGNAGDGTATTHEGAVGGEGAAVSGGREWAPINPVRDAMRTNDERRATQRNLSGAIMRAVPPRPTRQNVVRGSLRDSSMRQQERVVVEMTQLRRLSGGEGGGGGGHPEEEEAKGEADLHAGRSSSV